MLHAASAVRRWIACIALLCLFHDQAAADGDSFETAIAPFFEKHCVACHGPEKQESRLRLDTITGIQTGNRNLWTMIHERVADGSMPPSTRKQPDAADKKQLLASISQQQRALGSGSARRLNRRELGAALSDVTGLRVDFSQALPADGTVGGFDTGAEGLQEASDAVAQWLHVTRRAVDGIRFLDPVKETAFAVNLREVKDPRKELDTWQKSGGPSVNGVGPPTYSKPGLGMLLEPRSVGDRDVVLIRVPRPERLGILRLTLDVSVWKPVKGLPNPRLWVEIGGKNLDYREIVASADRPQRLVYEAHLGDLVIQAKGISINLSNKIEIPYAVEGFANEERENRDPPPGGPGLFRPEYDRRKLPVDQHPAPFVILHRIAIEPNVVAAWPPAAWKAEVGEIKDEPQSARRLLDLWSERAWRRPVTDAEKAPFLKLYAKLRDEEKMSFDDALRAAFQSILLSAPFRYQASPADPNPNVAQHAMASRLSFMLVGGPPDAELKGLAAAGKLKDPAILDREVDRLLADPRSQAFIRPFVMQWLEMEQPITIAQPHINKQDFRFARYLKASMREETIAYITQLFADNRPARELIVSDWTMMNDTLARHYGYDGIEGGHHRKVKLRADDPRGGGILGHAGLQSMLCWMGDNWVIYRGAWALRHILDVPPPPPPLEIPELNPADAKHKGKPFRELLKIHQEDTRCAVCHKNIDPVGFAFQNFDVSGRWRDVEHESYARGELDGRISWRGVGPTRPADVVGNLPRGEKFKTFAEFKAIIVKDYQQDLVRGILKNLFLYGTGRLPGIDEMEQIRSILKEHETNGYPLRDLVKAVVRSPAFLERNNPLPAPQPNLGSKSS